MKVFDIVRHKHPNDLRISKEHGDRQQSPCQSSFQGVRIKVVQDVTLGVAKESKVSCDTQNGAKNARDDQGPLGNGRPAAGSKIRKTSRHNEGGMLTRHGNSKNSKANEETRIDPFGFQDIPEASSVADCFVDGREDGNKDHQEYITHHREEARICKCTNISEHGQGEHYQE